MNAMNRSGSSGEDPQAETEPTRRAVLDAERDGARAGRGRRTSALTRRTTLSLAGSGAALLGVAAAVKKAPDVESLDEGTRDLAARQSVAAASSAAAARAASGIGSAPGTTRTKAGAKVEYQTTAAGKAPAPKAAPATVVQPPTILALDPALHLARRATWGPTPELLADIRRRGVNGWLERQLRPSTIPDDRLAAYLRPFDTLGWTPQQVRAADPGREKQDYFYAHTQLECAAIARAAWSERQLFEVMVDFWHSRVHVAGHIDKSRDTLTHYDAAVVRRYALGRFSDMLYAAITHPAMILYLDNQTNTKYGKNQNLGRELLELHTCGVDAGYKQADVDASAVLLTGLNVDPKTSMFVYRPELHQTGRVRVFGKTYDNSSAQNGLATVRQYLDDLAMNPHTARYLALDLARRFVADAPSSRLVNSLAAVYLKNRTAMVPVLRALFASPEFQHSVGQKYRRPLEHVVASVRALGMGMGDGNQYGQSMADLRYWVDQLGQSPLGCPTPDGFKDFAAPWLSTSGTLGRWNMDMSLAGQWRKGLSAPDVTAVIGSAATYGAAVDKLVARLTFQKATAAQRAALLTFLGRRASDPLSVDARRGDYRLRVQLPALLLGGPQHQLR